MQCRSRSRAGDASGSGGDVAAPQATEDSCKFSGCRTTRAKWSNWRACVRRGSGTRARRVVISATGVSIGLNRCAARVVTLAVRAVGVAYLVTAMRQAVLRRLPNPASLDSGALMWLRARCIGKCSTIFIFCLIGCQRKPSSCLWGCASNVPHYKWFSSPGLLW